MKKVLVLLFFMLVSQLLIQRAYAQNYSPVWINDIGGASGSISSAVVLDKTGNVYITGRFAGTATFNLKQGGSQKLTSNGAADIFIAKYDPVAGNYIWAIGFGGSSDEHPTDIAIDKAGNIIITGQYFSTINFNPKGSAVLTPVGAEDVFFAKYDPNGNFIWAKSIGESGTDRGVNVATDNNNNVFITGIFEGTINADPNGGNYPLVNNNGGFCQFIGQYDSNGNIKWAHALPGGFSATTGIRVAIDPNTGDIVVGGGIVNSFDFSYNGTTGATINPTSQSNFIAKYSNAGVYKWVKYLPGNGSATCNTLLINSASAIIMDANFSNSFYPNGPAGIMLTAKGANDDMLAMYSSAGNLQWSDQFGGSGSSFYGNDVCLDDKENIVMGGSFNGSIDFDPASANGILSSNGGEYLFISKYDPTGKSLAYSAFGGSCGTNLIYRLAANSSGVYVTGGFCSTVDFDPSPCVTDNITALSSSTDSFVGRYILTSSSTAPPASFTQSVCTGSTATLTLADAQTGLTYNWYDSATKTNLLFTGTSYVTGPINANTTYYVEAVSGTCSSSTLATVQVNVVPLPTAPVVVTPVVACDGSTAVLSVTNPQAGLTYNWYNVPTGGTIIATGNTISETATAPNTKYYVDAVNSNSCVSARTEVDITIIPIPVSPLIQTPVAVCSGSPVTLNISNPQATLIYNWYDQPTAGTLLKTGTQYTTLPLTANTTYYVEAVSTTGSCTSTRTAVTVTVNSLAVAPAPFTQPVCTGLQATLVIADAKAGITYNWYDSATKTNLLFTGSTYVTGTINANTTFYIEAVNGTCPAATLTTVQVNVIPLPTVPIVATPVVACEGSVTIISVSNPSPGISYNWYTVPTGGTIVSNGSTISITASTTNTAYYVEAVNSNGCVSPRAEVDVTVVPIPLAPVVQTPAAICSGSATTLNISNPQAGVTYNWYDQPTGGTLLTSGVQLNTLPLTANTTYYVDGVSNTGGCASTRTLVQVQVNQIPLAPAPFTESVCPGSVTTLTIADAKAGITYNWYDSATKNNLLFTGTSYVTGVINTNATYYIEAVNGTCPSTSLANVQVNVIPPPAAPAVVKNPLETCVNNQVTISINNPQGGLTYNWYITATGGTSIATGSSFLTPALTTGTTYYVEAANASGCVSPRTAVDVIVDPLPDISAQGASTCPNTSTTVTATSKASGVTINWYANATGGTILASGNSFATPVLGSNTNYYAEAVNNVTGCVSTSRAVAAVTILQQLAAPVVSVDETTSSSITFKWDAVTGATGYLVSIDNGATYTAPSTGSNGLSHTITGLEEGQTITILVEATGASDCQLSGSSTAVTGTAHNSKNDIIYIPNAFTPNGDGKNDVVHVHSNNIRSMDFYVYDQLGEMIFKSTDISVGWDGTYKGVKQPVGVYVYFVQAIMNDGQHLLKKGTITLLR